MTIVASFSIDGFPVLIGDLLVSSFNDEKNYEPLNIPTCDNVNAIVPPETWNFVSSLQRKLVLLNDRLAIAWAGNLYAAKAIIKELRDQLDVDTFTIDDVIRLIDGIDGIGKQDLFLAGIALERLGDEITIANFAWDHEHKWKSPHIETQAFGDVYAGGSGRDDLAAVLGEFKSLPEFSHEANPLEKAVLITLYVLGYLTGQQSRVSQGLSSMYGGGFELITLIDGKLQKVDDISYHLWQLKELKPNSFKITPHNTLKYSYIENYLLIRKFRVLEASIAPMPKDDLYAIPDFLYTSSSLERDGIINNLTRPSLNSKFCIIYLHAPYPGNPNNVFSFVDHSPTKDSVRYDITNGRMIMSIAPDLMEEIKSKVASLGKIY